MQLDLDELALDVVQQTIANLRTERDQVLMVWIGTRHGSKRDRQLWARLNELDVRIDELEFYAHHRACREQGRRHLRLVPKTGT